MVMHQVAHVAGILEVQGRPWVLTGLAINLTCTEARSELSLELIRIQIA